MSVESCRKAKQGVLRIVDVGDTKMGKLQVGGSDECVSVSLPSSLIESAEGQGPHETTLKGTIFRVPTDIEVATISVNGRKIGLGQCGSFYLFVEQ